MKMVKPVDQKYEWLVCEGNYVETKEEVGEMELNECDWEEIKVQRKQGESEKKW
jgi:hypothetical protein